MLIYNHAYDLYHSMFRILQILNRIEEPIEFDKLRILDFYLAFPSELLEIKRFRGFKKYQKYLESKTNPYERIINRNRLFYKMESIQLSAVKGLISYGLIDSAEFTNGLVKKTNLVIAEALEKKLEVSSGQIETLLNMIINELNSMELYGRLGLKERTNLIEFKYDAI